jgi:Leucine-rich repeat (LRR) protein
MHQKYVDSDISAKEKARHAKKIVEFNKKIEKIRPTFESLQSLLPEVSGNGNNMATAYINSLPANSTRANFSIYGEGLSSNYSARDIPDLSRISLLKDLNFDGHEDLSERFDRIPRSVERLGLYHTNFQDVSHMGQLVNLETVSLDRNYNIRELPDLSKLTRLRMMNVCNTGIKKLPNLPQSLDIISMSYIKDLFTKKEVKRYYSEECDRIIIERYKQHPIDEFIERIARENRFALIREDLMLQAAKIAMNPSRLARLLESGMDFDELDERENLFNYQKK